MSHFNLYECRQIPEMTAMPWLLHSQVYVCGEQEEEEEDHLGHYSHWKDRSRVFTYPQLTLAGTELANWSSAECRRAERGSLGPSCWRPAAGSLLMVVSMVIR